MYIDTNNILWYTTAQQFNPIRGSYLRHLQILLTHPTIFVGLVVMTVVKFTAGGLGFMVSLISSAENGKE